MPHVQCIFYIGHLTHFGHAGVMHHCDRPWNSVEEMDEALIRNWNSTVTKKDTIYILGDFAWKDHRKYVSALNGKKVLIKGNHDKMPQLSLEQFTEVTPRKELKIDGRLIVLDHYPMFSWRNSCHGSWHAHGHTHNSPFVHPYLAINVGVDVQGYIPVNWYVLKQMFLEKESKLNMSLDHHDTNPPQRVKLLLGDILNEFRKDEISLQRERLQEMYDLLSNF